MQSKRYPVTNYFGYRIFFIVSCIKFYKDQNCSSMKRLLIAIGFISLTIQLKAQNKILYGETAQEHAFEWVGRLSTETNGYFCNISLIGDRWALTAEHCLWSVDTSALEVVLNPYLGDEPMPYAEHIPVTNIYIHPDSDGTQTNPNHVDLALLELAYAPTYQPVNIANPGDDLWYEIDEHPAFVLGWGFVDTNFQVNDTIQLGMPVIIDKEVCQSLYPDDSFPFLKDWEICAGYKTGNKPQGVAFGDSGAPLFIEEDGDWTLIGITSRAGGTFTTVDKPGVFTKIETFYPWLIDITGPLVNTYEETLNPVQPSIIVFDQFLKVDFPTSITSDSEIMISDISGRLVSKEIIDQGISSFEVSTAHLNKGVYVFSVFYENGITTQRFLKY